MIKNVYCLYFSPTGSTKKIAKAAAEGAAKVIGCEVQEINFTKPDTRQKSFAFNDTDFLVIASPTYAGKLPNKILPDFQSQIKGNGTKAAAITTFGNRSFDNSLAEMVFTLEENGFIPVAGGAFVCRHAFTDKMAGERPEEADLKAAAEFAAKAAELAQGIVGKPENPLKVEGDAAAKYYVPKGTDGQPAKFLKAKPLTDAEKCVNCKACAKACPVGSISLEDVSLVEGVCIKCQACVRTCPMGAKYFEDPAFLSHVAMLEQNFTDRKENSLFYI